MKPGRARAMLVAAATCLAVIAYGFSSFEPPLSWAPLWPWVFGVAALACVWLAVTLDRTALFVSGVFVPLAFAARVVRVVIDFTEGAKDKAHTLTGTAVYALVGILAATVWVYVLGPLVGWMEQRRGRG